MQTLLLPCEKGTLSLTRLLPRVFSLCHPHSLEFGKLIPPSSWTSLDIPFLYMRLRVGWQLVKGHTALQNGIRIRFLSIQNPCSDVVYYSASCHGAGEGSSEGS